MAQTASTRLTAAEGRRFALTLAVAFALLALLLRWRGHDAASFALFAVVAALGMASVLAPSRLGPVHRAWMALGQAISKVTTPVILALLYYVFITPVGVLRRTIGRSPLAREPGSRSFWIARPPRDDATARRSMGRLF